MGCNLKLLKPKLLKNLSSSILLFTSLLTTVTHAGLIDRGNGMIYDDVLDITWLQNANLRGRAVMSWSDAFYLTDNLVYGGFDDWRLTQVYDVGNDGCNYSRTGGTDCGYNVLTHFTDGNGNTFFSELAYMFYENLGNVAYSDTSGNGPQTGWDILNTSFIDSETGETVSFNNLYRNEYWSGTELALDTNYAWDFGTQSGFQIARSKSSGGYAWAVRDGDVASASIQDVPEPTSIAIFALGLLGLMIRQRQRR